MRFDILSSPEKGFLRTVSDEVGFWRECPGENPSARMAAAQMWGRIELQIRRVYAALASM
jgi:hypothetical protein